MRLKIDSKKINSTSNIKNSDNNSNDVVHEIKEQLLQQLLFGNNSCFLISGYRGTGKTSLIKTLEDEIKEKNYLFVHLNLSKYEDYSLILRKLIREIYLTLSPKKIYKKIKNKQLVANIELLYDHTFYEIFSSSNSKSITEFQSQLEGSISLKDIVKNILPILAVVMASLNINFKIIPSFLNYMDIGILVLSISWFVIHGFKLNIKSLKGNSSLEELNRKSLYDNEIAEYHLRNILKGLESEDIKTIFVFDELDKIENEVDMASIIADLKPLLLSDLASFIVISGQKLYYKFINSSVLDDSIMTSIFAKNIHIPLTTNVGLEKVFNSYLIDNTQCNHELVKYYRDSLILNSHRTIRRFNNLILQDIEWDKKESYLYIDESNFDSYKTDSMILEILAEIIDSNIENSDYDIGVKDFLTYQLFIWIKKMKLKGKTYFLSDEVYNFEEDYSEAYPVWTQFQLNEMSNELIKKLLAINLLEKKGLKNGEEIYFRWTTHASIKIDGINNDQSQGKMKFLENMIEIEKYCRDILIDLKGNEYQENRRGLMYLVKDLVDLGVIRERWLGKNNKELYNLSNKIRHGETLSFKDLNDITSNTNYSKSLIYDLIEGYCYYVINRYLSKYDYNVFNNKRKYNSHLRYDIIAENNIFGDIIFEIKYRNASSSNDIDMVYRVIRLLMDHNESTQKRNKLVLFWFSKENSKAFTNFKDKFNKIIASEYDELQDDIYIFYASEYRNNFNSGRMNAYLDKVIKTQYSKTEDKVASTVDEN